MPIAYLNTEYPSLSHTFIEREIAALRERGLPIETFSVRRGGSATLGDAHAEAARTTTVLHDGAGGLVAALLGALLRRPAGVLRGILAGQRLSSPGLAARVRHLAYALQAIRLAGLLERRGIRHVHVHMANNGASVALLATRVDPRLTWSLTIHGSAEFFDVHGVRLAAKASDARFTRCISRFCRGQVMIWTPPEHWPRLHVVPTGLDVTRFAPREAQGTRRDGPLRIVTVGRLHPIKGYDVLLEAGRRLTERGVDWRLTLIGDGPLRAHLDAEARRQDVTDRVDFAGPVPAEALPARLAEADVLVVSSFMEGVPVVLMEAMAGELAVVSTKVGGVGELIDDDASGLLVDAGDPEPLADALERLATEDGLLERLGPAGRVAVAAKHSIDDVAEAMDALLRPFAEASEGEGTT